MYINFPRCVQVFRKEIRNFEKKNCSINIYLTGNPFTLNKYQYCLCKLLYMIITHYQNKTLYNKVFFGTNFRIYCRFLTYTESIQSLKMQVKYNVLHRTFHNVTILQADRYSFILFLISVISNYLYLSVNWYGAYWIVSVGVLIDMFWFLKLLFSLILTAFKFLNLITNHDKKKDWCFIWRSLQKVLIYKLRS